MKNLSADTAAYADELAADIPIKLNNKNHPSNTSKETDFNHSDILKNGFLIYAGERLITLTDELVTDRLAFDKDLSKIQELLAKNRSI